MKLESTNMKLEPKETMLKIQREDNGMGRSFTSNTLKTIAKIPKGLNKARYASSHKGNRLWNHSIFLQNSNNARGKTKKREQRETNSKTTNTGTHTLKSAVKLSQQLLLFFGYRQRYVPSL